MNQHRVSVGARLGRGPDQSGRRSQRARLESRHMRAAKWYQLSTRTQTSKSESSTTAISREARQFCF